MKFCPECGEKIEKQNARFCSECGCRLEAEDVAKVTDESPEKIISESSKVVENAVSATDPDIEERNESRDNTVDSSENDDEELDDTSSDKDTEEQITENKTDGKKIALKKIKNEFSKEEFIKKVWVTLAKEKAPIDVFNTGLSEVEEIKHRVLVDELKAAVSYRASVGYDRQEPYIDYETYLEDEPYVTTERYYDRDTKTYRDRVVTKYKKVSRQRQVTRYKTVTDWRSYTDNGVSTSVATVETLPDVDLDTKLFTSALNTAKKIVDTDEMMSIDRSVENSARDSHDSKIGGLVRCWLPGDRSRDVSFIIKRVNRKTSVLYELTEYKVTVLYEGKTYVKYAFPFGNFEIGGDTIENTESPEQIEEKIRAEAKHEDEGEEERKKRDVWTRTKWWLLSSIGLIVASIITSLAIPYPAPVIILFLLAIASYIACFFVVRRAEKTAKEEMQLRILRRKEETEERIKSYSSEYEKRLIEALNKKLDGMGFAPVSSEELGWREG